MNSTVWVLAIQGTNSLAWKAFCSCSVLYAAYIVGVIIYRLTLHPLARFPGPFLCRISFLQQGYYEAILQGKFIYEIPKYHKKYGPVVRLNPNEVHINDISVFHEIFDRNKHFTKDPATYSVGVSNAMTMTIPVEAHRAKRQVLDPIFSKRRVNMMENSIYEEIERIFAKIAQFEEQGEAVPIHEMYYCYTCDIVSELLFGKSLDMISAPDFKERVKDMQFFTGGVWIALHFPLLRMIITDGPRWLAARLSATYIKMIKYFEKLGQEAMARYDQEKAFQKNSFEETIFDRMLTNNLSRRKEDREVKPLKFQDLADESAMILNGGTEPPANEMAYATYYFLKYPEVQKRILEELDSVRLDDHGRLPLKRIENLPYFTGFVKESLRMATLIPGRLPRTVPKGGLHIPAINDTIPEGYVEIRSTNTLVKVGIMHDLIHKNPDIFPDPHEFRPERWLGAAGKELMHWLVSFSWGRTDCIGKNLAYAEMHLMLANIFSRFHLEMVPGTEEALEWSDRVIMHPHGFLHIKVKPRKAKSV